MRNIRIEKSTGAADFAETRAAWTKLFERAGGAPFLSWEWMRAWHENLGANGSICLIKAFENDELIGILPLFLSEKRFFTMIVRRLDFPGADIGGADYLDLIADDADRAAVWTAIFDFFAGADFFDRLTLAKMADASVGAETARIAGARAARRLKSKASEICPVVNLEGGWEQVLSGSRRRDNFKRRLKKLEKMDGFEFRSVTDAREIGAAFERFAFLHEKRWAEDGGSEATGLPQLMDFHRAAIVQLAEKQFVRFDEIWAEGECRASVYGLENDAVFYYYNAGYDLEWARHSVGTVLIGLSIRAAAERGNAAYDFLRGEETYKFDWANAHNRLTDITLTRPRARAAEFADELWSAARKTARRLLPKDFGAKLQNIRRNRRRNQKLRQLPGVR